MLFMTAGAVMYGVDKSEELKKLEAQRQELTWKIVDKRAELISSNPDLKQLHDQIMTLHREMALKLDANPEMQKLNADQMTLVVFKTLYDEVMDGGFVQLIYNGWGPFVFFNPFAKAVRGWGLDDLAALVKKAGKLFRKYGREIERECTDDEFMAMFENYPEFDDLDDTFVENEERWVEAVARYIDGHVENFATVEGVAEKA